MNTGFSHQQQRDYEVSPGCTDGVSEISFSPTSDLMAVSSWDNQTRIYDVQSNSFTGSITATPKSSISSDAPVLGCCWSADGSKVFSAGADKLVRALDVATGQSVSLSGHSDTVRSVRWCPALSVLVSGSWDRTLRYWDLRSGTNAVATLQLPERCYSLSTSQSYIVAGCAERHISIVSSSSPTTIAQSLQSPLKWQTRVVACYGNGEGYAVGSIEGRVSLNNFDSGNSNGVFCFKCQRDDTNIFAVNAISFHPTWGTFSTAGSDGTFSFWDREIRQRLRCSPRFPQAISSTAFNRTGSIFAYALSYDWSKGFEQNQRDAKNSVMLYQPKDSDVKPKSGSSSMVRRR